MANKTLFALITGCSSGIGKGLAVEFASRGVNVLATARDPASLNELTSRYANIHALALELTDRESIERLRDDVEKITGGRLDFLVNNAGMHYQATLLDSDIDVARKLYEVNVFAVMRLCQLFTPMLMMAEEGKIVHIGSVTRSVPVVWQGVYSSSKGALSVYTKTLRMELEPFGIKVIEIVTGFVQSNITSHGFHGPENSMYLRLLPLIQKFKVEGNKGGMPAADYAKSVVGKIMGRDAPHEIWEGTLAWKLWALVSFLPYRYLHRFFYKYWKVDVVRPAPRK